MVTAHEARRYADLGWSVVPIAPGTKRPPDRFPLSQYFERRATDSELNSLFCGDFSIAVCLGEVSDSLVVRDFDDEASYGRWATNHPKVAQRQPTARTSRGYHVYCNADIGDVRDFSPTGGTILVGSDGELKAGGYVLLPESIHPSGNRYEWEIKPDDVPYIGDIRGAGLLPPKQSGTQDIQGPACDSLVGLEVTIDWAIEATQPIGHGERHDRIFDFCRMLKSTPLADASRDELKPVFELWYWLAKPRIKTKQFQVSWQDFLDGWQYVERPYGASLVAIANCVTGSGITRLESLCQRMQAHYGDRPFPLDGRAAAAVIGSPHRSTARWLKRLVKSGRLELVMKGCHAKHLASEYRYRGEK